MQIGICDDNKRDMDIIMGAVETAIIPLTSGYELHLFYSGNELVRHLEEVMEYDILFLDIDMPDISGIEIADRLTRSKALVNVIFVTNMVDLVFEAIRYSPFRFIRKSRIYEEMDEAVAAVLEKIRNETFLYEFGTGREMLKILIRDMLYLESQGHYIHIHTSDEKVHNIRGKISSYDEKLRGLGFVRIHVGYLVNIRCIYSISLKGVVLDNGETLPISRRNADKIKGQHANYVRRFVRGIH